MDHRKAAAVAALAGAGLLAGCTTTTSFTEYDERAMYSTSTAGNIEYVEIGPVTASARGTAFTSCDRLTGRVADDLARHARRHGGNALINVRWINLDDGSTTPTPICTTGWGWFAVFGVGGLGPWVRGTRAEAVVVYMDQERLDDLTQRVADSREGRIRTAPVVVPDAEPAAGETDVEAVEDGDGA